MILKIDKETLRKDTKNDKAVSLVSIPDNLAKSITEDGINVQLHEDNLLRRKQCGYCKSE